MSTAARITTWKEVRSGQVVLRKGVLRKVAGKTEVQPDVLMVTAETQRGPRVFQVFADDLVAVVMSPEAKANVVDRLRMLGCTLDQVLEAYGEVFRGE